MVIFIREIYELRAIKSLSINEGGREFEFEACTESRERGRTLWTDSLR